MAQMLVGSGLRTKKRTSRISECGRMQALRAFSVSFGRSTMVASGTGHTSGLNLLNCELLEGLVGPGLSN